MTQTWTQYQLQHAHETRKILRAMDRVSSSNGDKATKRALRYLRTLVNQDEYEYLESFLMNRR